MNFFILEGSLLFKNGHELGSCKIKCKLRINAVDNSDQETFHFLSNW